MDSSKASSLESEIPSNIGVSSALVLGFGAIGGLGAGALNHHSKGNDSSTTTTSSHSTRKNVGHDNMNSNHSLNRTSHDMNVENDEKGISYSDKSSDDVKLRQNNLVMDNLYGLPCFVDSDAIVKDALLKLQKFNQVKTSLNYYSLIEDAWSMRNISSKSDEDFKLSLQIPLILPDILKERYLYW